MRNGLNLVFPGDAAGVRHGLKGVMDGLHSFDLGPEEKATVELVLAEVLNNVVEHAYQERGEGVIELSARQEGDTLSFQVLDDGVPMPQGTVPEGVPQDLDCEFDVLPEGGFGWFLIHEMTRDLKYKRENLRNQLTFRIPLDQAEIPK